MRLDNFMEKPWVEMLLLNPKRGLERHFSNCMPPCLISVPQILLLTVLSTVHSLPLEGFGDATEEEIAQIRAGTYLEMFDENPEYNYNYKVADSEEQTYVSMEEGRQGGVVTGSYSYVDPLVCGDLCIH